MAEADLLSSNLSFQIQVLNYPVNCSSTIFQILSSERLVL